MLKWYKRTDIMMLYQSTNSESVLTIASAIREGIEELTKDGAHYELWSFSASSSEKPIPMKYSVNFIGTLSKDMLRRLAVHTSDFLHHKLRDGSTRRVQAVIDIKEDDMLGHWRR